MSRTRRFAKSLPIYQAGYSMVRLVTEQVRNFPRDMRPTVGRQMQEEAVNLVLNVYKANAAIDKVPHINKVLEGLEVVEMLQQLSFDLRLINKDSLAESIDITGSIGAQAGGWRNSQPAYSAPTRA